MRSIISFVLLIFSFSSLCVLAATTYGNADVYKVTISKIELCEDAVIAAENSFTVTGCVTLGSHDLTVDIASVNAGAQVASYATTTGLPIGTTFKYFKPTVKRAFTFKGSASMIKLSDDSAATCVSNSAASYAAFEKYYTAKQGLVDGVASEDTSHMPTETDTDAQECLNPACTRASTGSSRVMDIPNDTSKYPSAISVGGTSDDEFTMVFLLPQPYTVGPNPPKINMAFGTRNALEVITTLDAEGIGDGCLIAAYWPKFTVTITD